MVHHSFWVTKKYAISDGKVMHLFIGMDALSILNAAQSITGKKYEELEIDESNNDAWKFSMETPGVGMTDYLIERREDRPAAPKDQPWSVIDGRSNVKAPPKGFQLKFF